MSSPVTAIIGSEDAAIRDLAIEQWCAGKSIPELLTACDELEAYRRRETNLYHRVRALFFLSTIHRYHLPAQPALPRAGKVPFTAFHHLLDRRFEEATSQLRKLQQTTGPSETLSSALAAAYHALAF